MESTAQLRFLRMAPRKVRLVADLVRGRPVGQALAILKFTPKAASLPVSKLLQSAIANATDRSEGRVDVDRLVVKTIFVDQATTLRRFITRSHGRGTRINKKTSHVSVVLADRQSK